MSIQLQFINDAPSQDKGQRARIIDALEIEIKHFTKAMSAIQKLPSSSDEGMGEAFDAYCKMIGAYQEMINVRLGIIERLKKSGVS